MGKKIQYIKNEEAGRRLLKGPLGTHNNQQNLRQILNIRRDNKHLFGTKNTGNMLWNLFNFEKKLYEAGWIIWQDVSTAQFLPCIFPLVGATK